MIIPSIDIQSGRAVQLVGGKGAAQVTEDISVVADRFGVVDSMAVIDLDAAMGVGDNRTAIKDLVRRHRCRVGGGIRTVESALGWLDAGAESVILGTAAVPEVLRQLPRSRVMAAVDVVGDAVMVEGWTTRSGGTLFETLEQLAPFVGGFLVTLIEREGRMVGLDEARVTRLIDASQGVPLTVAGGICTAEEVAWLDGAGADAQVGMALYSGALSLGDSVARCLKSDRPDGLIPTVVCDEVGHATGLVYSSQETLAEMVDTRRGIYQSRKRGRWVKGESSGNTQEVLKVELDCDRDSVRVMVRQKGPGFCHLQQWDCFGGDGGLGQVEHRLKERLTGADGGSYTLKVGSDERLLAAKLSEEAKELAEAQTTDEVTWEAADLIYFTLVALARRGVHFSSVVKELSRRGRSARRRDGSRVSDASRGSQVASPLPSKERP